MSHIIRTINFDRVHLAKVLEARLTYMDSGFARFTGEQPINQAKKQRKRK